MTKPFDIFGPASPEEEARADAEAEADIAAGRVVPHEDVRKWLLSWGQPDELPPPTCK
ncbi:MAG TPA: CopG family transcriptional regulator [Azospirillaceae bacterium]|nr:CopG family transcriptional regulator [Azospirillaceae bacterium]